MLRKGLPSSGLINETVAAMNGRTVVQFPHASLIEIPHFLRVEDIPRIEDVGSAEIEWDVEGVVPRGTVNLWTGEAGCGKSTLVSALGFSVSKGEAFLGRQTVRRPVLILDAENPAMAVLERFRRLGIVTDDGFRIWGQWTGEDPPAGGGVILEWIQRCDPKPLIVIDSFIRFHPESENDSGEVQKTMGGYRKLAASGATIIILHHIGKAETARDYRGSSDIKAAIDVAYKITNIGDGSRLDTLELRAFKQRISVTPHLYIKYDDGRFTTNDRDAIKTVTAQLVELLKENPGIITRDFRERATRLGLGRNRGSEFLSAGVGNGTIHRESSGRTQRHFWRGGSADFFGLDGGED